MQIKRMMIVSLLCLVIVACTSQQVTATPTPTNIPLPSATFTAQPISTSIPMITATPVVFDSSSQDITQIIDNLFKTNLCTKVDLLNNKDIYHITLGQPVFMEITNQVNIEKISIKEIADDSNGNYRAYLVDEPSPSICGDCLISRIYIQNLEGGKIYKLDWMEYLVTRNLSQIIWAGNNIIVTSLREKSYTLIGIDVDTNIFVYFSVINCE